MSPPTTDAAPLLNARGIVKRFGTLLANDVDAFTVHAGEIVALLGENGAGKSTLCKILYGYYRPNAGEIRMAGRAETIASPRDARRLGIGMVFQSFSLIPALTVWENVALFLDDIPWVIGPAELLPRMRHYAARLRLTVDPRLPVGRLAVSDRQKVEILKQLVAGARVLILDEPTKVLAPQELEGLFRTLTELRDDGYGVVFITHKLREVTDWADRVVVMRQGRIAATLAGQDASEAALLGFMFGTTVPLHAREAVGGSEQSKIGTTAETATGIAPSPRPLAARGERGAAHPDALPGSVVLDLEGITTAPRTGAVMLRDISLRLHAGEILGVAGVSGNGQPELAELILGLRRPRRGTRRLWGKDATTWSAARTRDHGVASIPDDPLALAAIPGLTVRENLALGTGRRYRTGLGVDWRRLAAVMDRSVARLRFPPLSYDQRAGVLSGGNLQRVVLARELAHDPKLIVALYPTRGLDTRSAATVRDVLCEARDAGAAVLLVSEDLDELFAVSDRLIVLRDGQIAGTFPPASFRAETVGPCMVGVANAA
jgi:general nucleoside transport system ATP-binding protein